MLLGILLQITNVALQLTYHDDELKITRGRSNYQFVGPCGLKISFTILLCLGNWRKSESREENPFRFIQPATCLHPGIYQMIENQLVKLQSKY